MLGSLISNSVVVSNANAPTTPAHTQTYSFMSGVTVQVAFKLLVLDRVLEEDSAMGDACGPYVQIYNLMCGVTVQVAFKLLVLDRVLEEDSVTGDAYGPYVQIYNLMCGVTVQVAFKLLVLDRVLEEDSVTGDAYGPYDADLVERERKRLRVEKVRPEALLCL